MSAGTAGAQRNNPWITRAGAIVFLALAVGLALSVGSGAQTRGYGDSAPAPSPTCGGYMQQSCEADVRGVDVTPGKVVAGKGFAVSFKTNSGGSYKIAAKRKGAKAKTLSKGATGTGSQTVKKLGKKLTPGLYAITVTIKNGTVTDSSSANVRVKKP